MDHFVLGGILQRGESPRDMKCQVKTHNKSKVFFIYLRDQNPPYT